MKKRFTDDQIIGAVKKLESGTTAKELSRELGVTIQTLYHWKKRFAGMDVVADLSLDIVMLKDVNSKKW